MSRHPSNPMQDAARAIHRELGEVDDSRFSRIVAMVDQVSNHEVNQVLLDPLRDRLAQLKPLRPLRLSRLMFQPLQPLIIPARGWRSGQARVPRTVLSSMASVILGEMGPEAAEMARAIAKHTKASAQAVVEVGDMLWPRAAEILRRAQTPENWSNTSLPAATFRPLAQAIATVLRRAPLLHRLMRDGEVGVLQPDSGIVDRIMRNIADEPPEGAAMVAQLILIQSPQAAELLRRVVTSVEARSQRVALNDILARGVEQTLSYLERERDFTSTIARSAPRDAIPKINNILTFLSYLDNDTANVRHKARVHAMRRKLVRSCEECFEGGLLETIVTPLETTAAPNESAKQSRLEAAARDLRTLETIGRQLGASAVYDRKLRDACKTVYEAHAADKISLICAVRLLETLGDVDAAAALYRPAMV